MALPANWVDSTGQQVNAAYLNELDTTVNAHSTALGTIKLWKGNAAAYAAVTPKDSNTVYVVTA